MSRVAVIGLGIMGLPMALNLARAGHVVTGYNRSPRSPDLLAAAGGRVVDSLSEAVRFADVVITMVSDVAAVDALATGEGGIFALAAPGTVWIDTSTISPTDAHRLAVVAEQAGIRPLDAPVSGGEDGAIAGSLSIMVGGIRADFEAVRDVFDAIGKTIVHVGPSGSGQIVKAANQLIVAANIEAVAEAIVFLEAHHADMDAALGILGSGLAGSKVLEQKGQGMLSRDFTPGARLALHHKDLGIVTAAARDAGVVTPVGAMVAQLVTMAMSTGNEAQDHSSLLRQVVQLTGGERTAELSQ